MTKMKANMALIKALEAWDIDHVYGIPGDSIDAVVDGLKICRATYQICTRTS